MDLGLAERPVTRSLFLGVSAAVRRAIALARKAAPTGVSVMITGEPGTGKRSLAQFIHAESGHGSRPFASVNCAAIDSPALLETVTGGTVFLEEVTAMPHSLQGRLLETLESGGVRWLGSQYGGGLPDVRFVSATSRDLREALEAGVLRKDLFYRLAVVPITLPPLKERPEDVPMLAKCFLAQHWERYRQVDGPAPQLTDASLDRLRDAPWRGNVAELRNVIEHVAALAEPGSCIQPEDIPLSDEPINALADGHFPAAIIENDYHRAKDTVVALFEKVYLTRVLDRALGNIAKAARLAAIDRATLYRLMDKHGIRRVDESPFRAAMTSAWFLPPESANPDTARRE